MNKTLLIIEKNPSGSVGLHKAKALGLFVIFIGSNKYYNKLSEDDRQYIDRIVEIDTNDEALVMRTVDALAREYHIDGVMTFMEFYVPLAAKAAQRLNLAGMSHQNALCARDKSLMRQRLSEAGVAGPAFRLVESSAEAQAFAREIGYPAIIKPVNMAGSRGVMLCHSPAELVSNFDSLQQYQPPFGIARAPCFLVEEFMDGPEFSVESLSWEGHTRIIAITRKVLASNGSFVELGHALPADVTPEQRDQITQLTKQALAALGVTAGGSHTEIKLTSKGPRIVEVAARLGGDNIPELVELATGVDMWTCIIQIALGMTPAIVYSRERFASIAFFSAEPGTIASVAQQPVRPAGVERIEVHAKVGARVAPLLSSADRLGFVISTGASPDEAARNLSKGQALVAIDIATEPATA